MPKVSDFSVDGYISERILQGLRNCPVKVIYRLFYAEKLSRTSIFPLLECRSLRYRGIEEYAKVTNLPLCYFFFGTMAPPIPQYTPYDATVIPMLNALSKEHLIILKDVLRQFFYHPFMDFNETKPVKRVEILIRRCPRGTRKNVSTSDHPSGLSEGMVAALKRYGEGIRLSVMADDFIDFAKYTGVSLHWIFGFKQLPLFCKSLLADEVYALYTLIQPEQRELFLRILAVIDAR